MRLKKWISVILCVAVTVSAMPFCLYAGAYEAKGEYIEGEVVIYSKKEVEDILGDFQTASDRDTVYVDFDGLGIDSIEELDTYSDEENLYIAETDGNVEKLCAELNKNSDIIAEPNYLLHTDSFQMPGEVANRTFEYRYYQEWYMKDVLHVPEAWQTHEVTGKGVKIAIIDNGFDITADDFPVNLWKNSGGTVGWNVCSNSDDISPIYKSYGGKFGTTDHGTNVAGIIGMSANGSMGVGIAYDAELMLIQAANYSNDSSDPMFSDACVARAIDFARTNGADIISMSLGSTTYSLIIALALANAKSAGILCVAAAGNDGYATSNVKHYPAALNTCIGVMAISSSNPSKLTDFSNYDTDDGKYYDIAAPGDYILGCGVGGGYSTMSGTSQATPIVAAVAALYMEKHPDWTLDQLKKDLLTSATDTVTAYNNSRLEYKSLNALKFLNYVHIHTWGEWTVAQEATCNAAGLESRRCSSCGKIDSRTIDKRDHLYEETVVSPTCTERGYTLYACRWCGSSYKRQYTRVLEHSFGEWTISGFSDDMSEVIAERSCIRCDEAGSATFENVVYNCDFSGNLISGINVAESVDSFIAGNIKDTDAQVVVTPSQGDRIGTGSTVAVTYATGDVLNYNVVIFGDLNGDGWYDGMDSVIDSGLADSVITSDSISEAVYMAADCNHDGVIDSLDAGILRQAGVLLSQVDQSKSPAELYETSAAYVEYCNLIEQTVSGDKTPEEPGCRVSIFERIVSLFFSVWKSIFSLINA